MARKKEDNSQDHAEAKASESAVDEAQMDNLAGQTKPAGRPTSFNEDIAATICAHLADGMSLRSVCSMEGMPDKATVFRWIRKYPSFCDQYEKAKEESADALVEEMLDIADDGTNDWMEKLDKDGKPIGWMLNGEHVQRSRLRLDIRKWAASKLKPKKYGDLSKVELTGKDGGAVEMDHFNAALEDLMVTLEKKLGRI